MKISRMERQQADDIEQVLQSWFSAKMEMAENVRLVSVNRPSGAAGFSADTFLVDLEWDEVGNSNKKRFVIRSDANASLCPEADYNKMLGLLRVIGDMQDLPVPKVHYWEEDTSILGGPFFAMEFVEGKPASDTPHFSQEGWVFDARPDQREQMYQSGIRFLAQLGQVDWQARKLDFLLHDGAGKNETDRHLNRIIEIYDKIFEGKRSPLVQDAIDFLKENLPEEESLVISWGDCRPGNVLWNNHEVAAAIDWEMAGLGDPSQDVAMWTYTDYMFTEISGNKRLPGMIERNEFKDLYEEYSNISLVNLDYFDVFVGLQLVGIITDMTKKFMDAGQEFIGDGSSLRDNIATKALESRFKDVNFNKK